MSSSRSTEAVRPLVAGHPEPVGLDAMGLPVHGEREHGRRQVRHPHAPEVTEGRVAIESGVDRGAEDRLDPVLGDRASDGGR